MDWRHRAVCRDEDPELFFPIGNTGPALMQIEEAKAVCRRCNVVETCLQWALESGQDAGVWGGLSEDERRALKRRTARARARVVCRTNPPRTPACPGRGSLQSRHRCQPLRTCPGRGCPASRGCHRRGAARYRADRRVRP